MAKKKRKKEEPAGARVAARAATTGVSEALDCERVRLDVGMVMRDVVIRSTPFTAETYTPLLVPKKAPPSGWQASLPNWAMTLEAVASETRALRPEYRVLHVTVADAQATKSKPLYETTERLTDRIMQATRAMLTGAGEGSE